MMITTTQAAARLGVPPRNVQYYIQKGQLKATKTGRDWLISETDLAAFEIPRAGRPATKKAKGRKR